MEGLGGVLCWKRRLWTGDCEMMGVSPVLVVMVGGDAFFKV